MRTYGKSFIFIAFFLLAELFFGCGNKNVNEHLNKLPDTLSNKTKISTSFHSKKDSLVALYYGSKKFSFIVSVSNGQYTMELETFCINDTLNTNYAHDSSDVWPIIEKQKLIFKYKDSVTNQFFIPLKEISRKNHSGKTIRSLDAFIWNLNTLIGLNGTIFSIDGNGTCEGKNCQDFIGLYSLSGEPILQEYINEGNNIGGLHKVLVKYGISDSLFRSYSTKGTRADIYRY